MNRVYSATGQFPARQIKEGCIQRSSQRKKENRFSVWEDIIFNPKLAIVLVHLLRPPKCKLFGLCPPISLAPILSYLGQFYLIFGHRGVAEYSLSKDAVFALSSTVKATAKSVQALLTDVSKAKEIIARFSIEPEIEIFLKKVSAQQATVFDLATEVLSWLKNQGLTGKLKVYFYQKIIGEFRLSL